jgi:hypothetical protein
MILGSCKERLARSTPPRGTQLQCLQPSGRLKTRQNQSEENRGRLAEELPLMSAVSAPALTATMLDDDAWDDLLSFIEERRVVPIVGPELLMVATERGPRLLYEWAAERLAARLNVDTAQLPQPYMLNDVVCVFLAARGRREEAYVRLRGIKDHFAAQKKSFASVVYPFITPFVPEYASPEHRAAYWKDPRTGKDRPPNDYTYEREWRVPCDLQFDYADVAFVLVTSHADISAMPSAARAALPADKWINVSNYRKIEELWPQHNLGGAV